MATLQVLVIYLFVWHPSLEVCPRKTGGSGICIIHWPVYLGIGYCRRVMATIIQHLSLSMSESESYSFCMLR